MNAPFANYKKAQEIAELNKDMMSFITSSTISADEIRKQNDIAMEILSFRTKADSMTDEEKISQGRKACYEQFIRNFYTEDMAKDFPYIAACFIKHEAANLDSYNDIYLDPLMIEYDIRFIFMGKFMNKIVSAYEKGSKYARDFLVLMYKTYYKKEYQQLKKFNKLTPIDVDVLMPKDMSAKERPEARILAMAEFMGIDVSECGDIYLFLNDDQKKFDQVNEKKLKMGEDLSDKLSKLLPEDDAEYDKLTSDLLDKGNKYAKKVNKFVYNLFLTEGCTHLYRDWYAYDVREIPLKSEHDMDKILDALVDTHLFLKDLHPNKEFSELEFLLYMQVTSLIRAIVEITDKTVKSIDQMLIGHECAFDPSSLKNYNEIEPNIDNETPKTIEKEETQDNVVSIEDYKYLEEQVRMLKNEHKQLKEREKEINALKQEKEKILKTAQSDKKELAILREHVYKMAEHSQDKSISIDEMKHAIKDINIMIVGGDDNWQKKLKKVFPNWTYIDATVTGTSDPKILFKADMIYFFTDIISHSTYFKYMNTVKENDLPFNYIHEVNIKNNIRQIYEEIKADEII